MAIKIITEPTTEPVSLQECKDHLRIVHDDEDTLIESYAKAARRYVEQILCWRALITQELELVLDKFQDQFKLPRPPLQEVTSIKYTDKDGTEHTVDADDYIVDTDSEPGRIVLAHGKYWPTDTLVPANAVRIRYRAGYGTYTGTVNVTNGEDDPYVNVSWQSGDKFDTDWQAGQRIAINGSVYTIASVTDDENMTVNEDAEEALTGVNYSVNFVPEELRQGILILTAHFYEMREPVVVGQTVANVPWTVEALALPYRAWGGDVE